MIIGIDNALSGGIAAISIQHGLIIAKTPMPTIRRSLPFRKTVTRKKAGKPSKMTIQATENMIDAVRLIRWIQETTQGKPCRIAIEACPEHAQQKSTMRSMAMSYGILFGAISAALPEYQITEVRSGNPEDSWQRRMLGKTPKDGTKPAAIAAAGKLWPGENWLATHKCKTPHDGMIDAALIAEFTRTSRP